MKTKKQKIMLRSFMFIFIVFLFWSIFHKNYKEVLNLVLQTPIKMFLLILVLGMIYQLIEAGICFLLVRRYLKEFSFHSAFYVVFIGFFTNIASMGTGIIPAKSYYLYKHGMPPGQGVSVMTYEYIFNKTSVLLWVLILLPSIFNIMWTEQIQIGGWLVFGIVITAGIDLLLILLCTWGRFREYSFYILEKIPLKCKWEKKKETWKEQIDGLYRESSTIAKDKKLIVEMMLLNMLKLSVFYFMPWVALTAVGAGKVSSFGQSFVLASVMILLTNAIPHVAGVGPAEYAFLLIYGFFTSHTDTLSAMLLYRSGTYFFPFLISVAVVLRIKKQTTEIYNKHPSVFADGNF